MLSHGTDADPYKRTRLDYHATVRELPSHERLQHFGPQALSMAELLAIILRTGTRGDNALELANKLLAKYGGLPGLVRADFRELCAEHGMGEAKSAQVKAALVQPDTRCKISTPSDAANLVMLDLAYLDTEVWSPEQELVQDLITITHCFSSRLDGLRTYRKVLKKAIADDQSAQDQAQPDA